MKVIKTKGIILNKKDINDGDLSVTIFTEEMGKIKATAFGVKKSKKKEIFSLNPLNFSEILLNKKNEFYNIKDSTLLDPYLKIKGNIEKLELALYILDSVNKVFDISYEKNMFYYKLLEIITFINEINYINEGYKYFLILTFLRRLSIEEGIFEEEELKNKLGENLFFKFKKISLLRSIEKFEDFVTELRVIAYLFEEYINQNLDVKLKMDKFIIK